MFAIFLSFQYYFHNFLAKKKPRKKTILRPPDWPQFFPPAGQETRFFKGWPEVGEGGMEWEREVGIR